ncbi:hypothetical protein F5148DRAFT_1187081 [Russula earlei]|uniref:Uncharacterized protein n=1 Tax=Russula earlei TaxID=71964 RepID=A0ACC0UCX0_9AGAM|nr:hypothetical protein F5148DRAFT_1187081 [Russula earlei]
MHAPLLRASYPRCGLKISRFATRSSSAANNSANPYPYPSNLNPTPLEIFHLPPGASQRTVKSRYYELVRVYHPDSPIARAQPPEVSEARFHAISASYDVLRGRRAAVDPDSADAAAPRHRVDLHALWRAKQQRHLRRDPTTEHVDDRWKDSILFGSLVLALAAFVYQVAATRHDVARGVPRRNSKGSGAEGVGRASERIDDARLLTAPDSDLSGDTSSS